MARKIEKRKRAQADVEEEVDEIGSNDDSERTEEEEEEAEEKVDGAEPEKKKRKPVQNWKRKQFFNVRKAQRKSNSVTAKAVVKRQIRHVLDETDKPPVLTATETEVRTDKNGNLYTLRGAAKYNDYQIQGNAVDLIHHQAEGVLTDVLLQAVKFHMQPAFSDDNEKIHEALKFNPSSQKDTVCNLSYALLRKAIALHPVAREAMHNKPVLVGESAQEESADDVFLLEHDSFLPGRQLLTFTDTRTYSYPTRAKTNVVLAST